MTRIQVCKCHEQTAGKWKNINQATKSITSVVPPPLYDTPDILFPSSTGSSTPYKQNINTTPSEKNHNSTHKATLPLIPFLPPPLIPTSFKNGSKFFTKSPFPFPPDVEIHEACTTCRHKNNIENPCPFSCTDLSHIGHRVFAGQTSQLP